MGITIVYTKGRYPYSTVKYEIGGVYSIRDQKCEEGQLTSLDRTTSDMLAVTRT